MACNSFATRILPIFCVIKSNKITLSSPRSWGCFRLRDAIRVVQAVFPTLVGVFLTSSGYAAKFNSLPHARGGVSTTTTVSAETVASSPRSWGCFSTCTRRLMERAVFPTLVGVFPCWMPGKMPPRRLPHARGGVSQQKIKSKTRNLSSPRSWGCFSRRRPSRSASCVFPTLVGVFPPCR